VLYEVNNNHSTQKKNPISARAPDGSTTLSRPTTTITEPPLTAKPVKIYTHGDLTKNDIFISVDDGWSEQHIEDDLRTADRYAIPLTFFPAGTAIQGKEEVFREIFNRGHAIENHTFNHNIIYQDTSTAEIIGEIEDQKTALSDAIGVNIKQRFFRPPGGDGILWDNHGNRLETPYPGIIEACQKLELDVAIWNIDSNGWMMGARNATPEAINYSLNNVTKDLSTKGKGGIILTHAIADDAAALPLIVEAVKARGLEPRSMRILP